MKIALIYGSPTPPGRLYKLLDYIGAAFRKSSNASIERVDPKATKMYVVGEWHERDVSIVSEADVVILSSPVFRGSLTGTLKILLDLLSVEDLRSKPVGIVTMGAAPQHFLSAERHMRDILSWFGALVAPNSLFFVDHDFERRLGDSDLEEEVAEFVDQIQMLYDNLSKAHFGPDPLTLRFRK